LELFKAAEENGQSAIETRLSKARFLHSIGENDTALKELEAFSEQNGVFETGPIAAYIKALKNGEAIDGLLTRDLLDNTERSAEAMRLYKDVPDSSHYVVSAKLAEANVYFGKEEDENAIKVLEGINAKHPSFITREALGRARLIRENYEDALPIYVELVNSMSEEDLKGNTQPLYFRGISYERTKQWDKAEADFKRVLEIEPDNADALNYLGYTWVDRGENLTEAFEMIRRALELEPEKTSRKCRGTFAQFGDNY